LKRSFHQSFTFADLHEGIWNCWGPDEQGHPLVQVFFFSEPSEGYSQGIIIFVQQMMLRYIIYQLLKSLKFMHSGQAPADAPAVDAGELAALCV